MAIKVDHGVYLNTSIKANEIFLKLKVNEIHFSVSLLSLSYSINVGVNSP